MQLTFDSDVEEFRAEFAAFLDENLPPRARPPSAPARAPTSRSGHGAGSGCCSTTAGCCPASHPNSAAATRRFSSSTSIWRNCAARRIYHSFNPQGVGIIAASLLSFGTEEQKQRWAVPILRAEITASLGMSEPGAGSDLASLRTRAVLDGDHFVVNGQKVWTSGAHDADVLLTFVRTDPDAPKHKGISALIIPTDTPGVVRRPFPSICAADDLDFNEVFFTDVRVPAENLVGELNQGWRVANGSLGHERTMMWLGFADRLDELIADFHPSTEARPRPVRQHDHGQAGAAPAGFGGTWPAPRAASTTSPAMSVLKLLGSEAELRGDGACADVRGSRRARPPGPDRAVRAHEPRPLSSPVGSSATRAVSPARSPAAPPRSSATSSPSECSVSHGANASRDAVSRVAFHRNGIQRVARPGRIW